MERHSEPFVLSLSKDRIFLEQEERASEAKLSHSDTGAARTEERSAAAKPRLVAERAGLRPPAGRSCSLSLVSFAYARGLTPPPSAAQQ